ncbi:hypothetical protein BDP81DRAFT_56904 [Colletotrichum phormii]|uniref:CENP-V/GFA domain-containing protein n=1 Tax=Colletotrichum phormii TaxID=359342 RepID=A0AAJ0EEP7_9PEZI|nr:uncharacterized protein BDP81DRAFT_56904 [Colletotrichum phormii]KAK1634301.1 hypothetical protein BDP81DRAFT_56904 [Colletotrichum phormii]
MRLLIASIVVRWTAVTVCKCPRCRAVIDGKVIRQPWREGWMVTRHTGAGRVAANDGREALVDFVLTCNEIPRMVDGLQVDRPTGARHVG